MLDTAEQPEQVQHAGGYFRSDRHTASESCAVPKAAGFYLIAQFPTEALGQNTGGGAQVFTEGQRFGPLAASVLPEH